MDTAIVIFSNENKKNCLIPVLLKSLLFDDIRDIQLEKLLSSFLNKEININCNGHYDFCSFKTLNDINIRNYKNNINLHYLSICYIINDRFDGDIKKEYILTLNDIKCFKYDSNLYFMNLDNIYITYYYKTIDYYEHHLHVKHYYIDNKQFFLEHFKLFIDECITIINNPDIIYL